MAKYMASALLSPFGQSLVLYEQTAVPLVAFIIGKEF